MMPKRLPDNFWTDYHGKLQRWALRRRAFLLLDSTSRAHEYRELAERQVEELIAGLQARADGKISSVVAVEALHYGFVRFPSHDLGPAPPEFRSTPVRWLTRLTLPSMDADTHRLFVLPAILDVQCESMTMHGGPQSRSAQLAFSGAAAPP
jgi:hypothetical protein